MQWKECAMCIASGSWFTRVSWLENTIKWQNKIKITIKEIWVHPLICTSGHTYTCYCATADKKCPQASAHARVEKLTRAHKCMSAARMRWHAYTHVYWSDHNYKHTHVCAFYIQYRLEMFAIFWWRSSECRILYFITDLWFDKIYHALTKRKFHLNTMKRREYEWNFVAACWIFGGRYASGV